MLGGRERSGSTCGITTLTDLVWFLHQGSAPGRLLEQTWSREQEAGLGSHGVGQQKDRLGP